VGQVRIAPCRDDAALAAARKRELDLPAERAAALGWSAWSAAREGHYAGPDGAPVDWKASVQAAIAAKLSIAPQDPLPIPVPPSHDETRVVVANETTLGAAHALVDQGLRPLALNFANGTEVGGGVLRGARAQEEVLCRSSALLATLDGDRMYEAHRRFAYGVSSAWVILSPDVPVFRHDDGTALPAPWTLSFLTCAAPYAPAVGQPAASDLLKTRIARVLDVARAYTYDTLVLGAWGCGAFGNDPVRTATDFREALEGRFDGAFGEVVFAIADWSPERKFLGPFRDVFSAAG
jgi:uncharacterized protein (TIGR02452 family)